jgi:DNA mismatch endonuclease (patch repair protein)
MPRPDVSPEKRSHIMAAVKGTGSKSTEWRLRGALVRFGVSGWRMNAKDVLGKPDFLFEEQRLAVFVDGCFWHGCPQHYRRPSTSQSYWDAKVARNIARDEKTNKELTALGYRVVRFWEHAVRESTVFCVERIKSVLKD